MSRSFESSSPLFEKDPDPGPEQSLSVQGAALMTLVGLFGIILVAMAFSQWNQIQRQSVDMERARQESESRSNALVASAMPATANSATETAEEVASRRAVAAYVSDVKPLVLMWRDALTRVDLADSDVLPGALNTMREVESRIASVVAPVETQKLHDRLLVAMGSLRREIELSASGQATAGSTTGVDSGTRGEFEAVAAEMAALQSNS